MQIDYDVFLSWAEERFMDVQLSGNEIKINSPFSEDSGKHLWCNPSKNAYHCWKSNKHGNLYSLVAEIDGCDYPRAIEILNGDFKLRRLEDTVRGLFKKKPEVIKKKSKLTLPENTFRIDSLGGWWRERSENYIKNRGLPLGDLHVCTSGNFYDRIIIPYYDSFGELIYFNGRSITDKKLRYMGPPKEVGVGKGDVLWFKEWKSDKIYLTEGEFDAISLCQCGFPAGACGGKEVSVSQMKLLHGRHVVICFDQDKSGAEALNKVGSKLISNNVPLVSYVRPAVGYKDWNNMLIKLGTETIIKYISKNERRYIPIIGMHTGVLA